MKTETKNQKMMKEKIWWKIKKLKVRSEWVLRKANLEDINVVGTIWKIKSLRRNFWRNRKKEVEENNEEKTKDKQKDWRKRNSFHLPIFIPFASFFKSSGDRFIGFLVFSGFLIRSQLSSCFRCCVSCRNYYLFLFSQILHLLHYLF